MCLNYFVRRQEQGRLPARATYVWRIKKREILHTFLSNVEHAKCLVEMRIHQKSKKIKTTSCFHTSLQATEFVYWIQKGQHCDGLVECLRFLVVWQLVNLKPWSQTSSFLRHEAETCGSQNEPSQFYKTIMFQVYWPTRSARFAPNLVKSQMK